MWLADEWFAERGFKLNEVGRFVRMLPNGCNILVHKEQLAGAPFRPVDIDICLVEQDESVSIVTVSFGAERNTSLDLIKMFSAILETCYEELSEK